ncbi:MAG: dTMP kinase [Cyanobacteriota bacterium]|nr:dTMP kinase [Cyanobacteriota bacterium]
MVVRGRLVVLEGIDGCGKTTQIEALRHWLPLSGLMPPAAEVVVTREPGGTAFGQALRDLLLHPPADQVPAERAELLLYAADRAQHVVERIEPSLAAGHWVLSDRFTGSTAAYQGHGRGLPLEAIRQLEQFATDGLRPDLTLWLDVPLEEALQRRRHRGMDRIEAEGEAFLQRVLTGFQSLATGEGWRRVEALGEPELVSERCRQALLAHFSGREDGVAPHG